jgi:carbonic anhydrase/acetyltransferase-like protein (isoleucine patch superfamily)
MDLERKFSSICTHFHPFKQIFFHFFLHPAATICGNVGIGKNSVFFVWQQSEGGTNVGWCISGRNKSHLLEKGVCRQKKNIGK